VLALIYKKFNTPKIRVKYLTWANLYISVVTAPFGGLWYVFVAIGSKSLTSF